MEIKVRLSHFTAHLAEVKAKYRRWPHLDETQWLCDNFKFSDIDAVYEPQPDEPYKSFTFQLARN
jgi:hypothetical protein